MTDALSSRKLPLPSFLKVLTNNGVPVPKAMAIASKIYKEFNSPESLSHLTDAKLVSFGINDKETRKVTLNAIRKAGYTAKLPKASPGTKAASKNTPENAEGSGTSQSRPAPAVKAVTTPTKRKRKRDDDLNDLLPNGPRDEASSYGSLEFEEVMDEEILKAKSTVVNRAPLMTAWSTIVAERMGFQREEALSIASVYTEMNAISKGVSLGIYSHSKAEGVEATKDGTQPYVELMGRSPLYQTQSSQWRALSNSSPALPSTAFSYISRSFRQTTPYIIGSLRLLAESYTPHELNSKGFSLYADFRPAVDGWGKRGEVKCGVILALRGKNKTGADASTTKEVIKIQESEGNECLNVEAEKEPDRKKSHGLTLEEYEAILDQDPTFDDLEFT